jgi:hypothetical protein
MSYGIDEGVVLFIAADFANQEYGIEDEPANDQSEEDDPEHEERDLSPV